MADGWNDLDEVDLEYDNDIDELAQKKLEIDKIFLDVWNTPEGKRMFDYLRKRYLDIPIARLGDTEQDVFYRQGKADLVRDMINVLSENSLN